MAKKDDDGTSAPIDIGGRPRPPRRQPPTGPTTTVDDEPPVAVDEPTLPGEVNVPVTEMKPGERTTVRFAPQEGTIRVTASAAQVGLGDSTGKIDPNPDDGGDGIGVSQKQNVDVTASLFPPGATSAAKAKTFEFRDALGDPAPGALELGVRPEQARRPWKCVFANSGRTTANVSGTVSVVPRPEVDEPPAAEVSVDSAASLPVIFLRPGDTALLPFRPSAGVIEVSVFAAEVDLGPGTGKVDPNPDDGGDGIGVSRPQNVTVNVELRPEGGAVVAGGTFRSKDVDEQPGPTVRHSVSAALAGRNWECRLENRSKEDIRCAATVSFVDEGLQTEIPLVVLNNGLRQLVAAIGLTVRIDGKRAVIGVTPELQAFAKGLIGESLSVPIDLPATFSDINLFTFGVRALTESGRAVIRAHARFEASGDEVDDFMFKGLIPVDVDLGRLAITIDVTLRAVGNPGRRHLQAIPEITVDVAAFGEIFGFLGIGVSDRVRDQIVEKIDNVVNSAAFKDAVRGYLSEGLVHLVQQGHEFQDLLVDDDAFIVVHKNPDPGTPPGPPQPPHVSFPRRADVQPAPTDDASAARLTKIDHLVVLMQENRSFDHLLGYLSHPGHGLERLRRNGRDIPDGLTGEESNPLRPGSRPVKVAPYGTEDVILFDRFVPPTSIPFSPHHAHDHVVAQIDDGTMRGFAVDFTSRYPNVDPQLAMSFYTDAHLPMFDELAAAYAVCDRWFSPHPGPTQPNRFCTLSGHTPVLDNFPLGDPIYAYLRMPTIFDVLTEAGVDWVYFEGDVGFLRMYDRYRLDSKHVVPYGDPANGFRRRAELGLLPPVTFIDPNFADIPPAATANDDHPPADLRFGQRLIAEIYDALRRSPTWVNDNGAGTLFVVTYDEHGGFYDHVAPPGTPGSDLPGPVAPVHPDGKPFYGPRVPTFAISPFVRPGSVDSTVYDHTSIIATILRRFVGEFPVELGPRPAVANHLGNLLTLDEPRPTQPLSSVRLPNKVAGFRETRADPDGFHAGMRALAQPRRR